ncbi:aldehyde dehydrogenase family protein [Streptomyces sp. LHD-70]|uniref:aldehyde dehydrogenase family protein n=1 Tax=Streptomyces sp. LHD-70 TaxID=3072140 RepID=UPI0028100B00|nr:aldehyde dehydrogenase family protein [Streptomyces sp. LHD-70]MDQ8708224.1 aldehyde dehydrogenase family protein [Streptomyces sp. LHD-70]
MPASLENWIDGAACPPSTAEYSTGINPSNGKPTIDIAASGDADVHQAVTAARRSADAWRHHPSAERGRILHRIADSIRENADHLADLEVEDTGKPRATALGEVENSAAYFEFYAGLVNLPVGDVLDVEPNQHIFTKREPYGVIGVITPWNVPLNQAARAVAPALATGNVVVLKPAETSGQTTIALAELASRAGLPDGVFNVVLGAGSTVGTAIVAHPDVRKVAFTGSVRTGQAVGRIAAERIIPLTLELGGKSANIVFDDADLDLAAKEAVRAFAANAGQVCSAGTRLLVQRSIHDFFVARVAEIAGNLREGQDVGPMITRPQFDQVQEYFDLARQEGAHALLGGSVSERPELSGGLYVQPTIYAGVSRDMRIAREEIFGPVLVTLPFDDEKDAVSMANDSDFGLVAGVFTKDIGRALRISDAIEAGQVFVNSWSTGAVQTPFGGHKKSGYGREKGIEAMHHYTHLKSVVVVY